ncbi:hypothetical protein SteCoe_28153 [Stentor coeruleus]|uniref:Uncharacterized protein n=1 Tax=Stentor coeruleus TaxID=5963 RepID=A0A1R2B8U8_9CILI|nr:hypothetical protein SteCoe_28153 [Stentor coeruleus]
MIKTFDIRQKNFMKPSFSNNSAHEKFATNLRREKRLFHLKEIRRLTISSNSPIQTTSETIQIELSETSPTDPIELSETLLTISQSLTLDKDFIKNSCKNIKEIIKCTLKSLDQNNEEILETSLSVLEKLSRIENLLSYLKDPEIIIRLLCTLELGIDSLYSYILNILANLCHEYTEVADILLKNNYLEQLSSIAYNITHLVKLTAYALLKIIEKSSKKLLFKDMEFVIKIIEIAKKNPENDYIILTIVDFLDDSLYNIKFLNSIHPIILRNLKNKTHLNCVLSIINSITDKEIHLSNYLTLEILNLISEVFINSTDLKKPILFIISNFVVGTNLDMTNFLFSDLKKNVVSCINHPSFSLRKECSFVFRNIGIQSMTMNKIHILDDYVFEKIAMVLGVDPIIDKNYLIFVSSFLDFQNYESKVLNAYKNSNINDKIIKLEMSKNEEISKLASFVLEKCSTIDFS